MRFWKVSRVRRGGDPSKSGAPVNLPWRVAMSPCRHHHAAQCTSRAWWARWEACEELWVSDRGASPACTGFLPLRTHIQLLNHSWKAADGTWQPVCPSACGHPATCTDFHTPKLRSEVRWKQAARDWFIWAFKDVLSPSLQRTLVWYGVMLCSKWLRWQVVSKKKNK